jgi:hypothetical protein
VYVRTAVYECPEDAQWHCAKINISPNTQLLARTVLLLR